MKYMNILENMRYMVDISYNNYYDCIRNNSNKLRNNKEYQIIT